MDSRQIEEITVLIKKLNPSAKIITSSFSNIPLDAVLNTKLFDYNKASTGAMKSDHSFTSTIFPPQLLPDTRTNFRPTGLNRF